MENNEKNNPNASISQEIDEQHVDGQAGTIPAGYALGVSDRLGNDGDFCTATVECQRNCNK